MADADGWLTPPLLGAMLFADTEAEWDRVKIKFHGHFKAMAYGGEVPGDDDVLQAIAAVKTGLGSG